MSASVGTITRVVLLVISLANMACASLGIIPEDIVGDSNIYNIISVLATVATSLYAAWKNNSFTLEAILADEYLASLIEQAKDAVTGDSESTEE